MQLLANRGLEQFKTPEGTLPAGSLQLLVQKGTGLPWGMHHIHQPHAHVPNTSRP